MNAIETVPTTTEQWVGIVAGSGKSKYLFGSPRAYNTLLMRVLKSDIVMGNERVIARCRRLEGVV